MSPLAAVPQTTLQQFGSEPFWITLVKAVVIFLFLVVMTLFAIWFERRVVARMQNRLGPNVHGPFGLLQSLADGLKLAWKEGILPTMVDKPVYLLAPAASAIPAFLAFAVIPLGPTVSIAGHHVPLQVTDLPVGVLWVLAMSSLGVYGVVLAGWASGSSYPLLGALRSAAQMISYEVAMGLSFVAVFLTAGSLSTSQIVAHQGGGIWYCIVLAPSFVIYYTAAVGETNRAPFDLPEAESELVGGYHTEYSSLGFALFFLAEYINMVTVSALCTTLFFGGWRAPWPLSLWAGANAGWWPLLWFTAKVLVSLFVFVWLRGTLPRLRYDQFMQLGWKILVPISLVWLLAVDAVRILQDQGYTRTRLLAFIGVPAAILLLFVAFFPERRRPGELADEVETAPGAGPGGPAAPPPGEEPAAFPTPPMDLVVPSAPDRRQRVMSTDV